MTAPDPTPATAATPAAPATPATPAASARPTSRSKQLSQRTVSRRMAIWVDDRLGSAKFARTVLNKVFPDHWSFMIGELALYCFLILLATGVYLTFFFDPSSNITTYQGSYEALRGVEMTEAYRSSLELSFDVRAGLVMRQMHHWAALLFLASIVVHLGRVFFTGAFRRPRELNWIIGVTLMTLALFNGLAGYSLLDDQLSGTGLRIVYSIALSIPLIGTWITSLVFGGEFPGHATPRRRQFPPPRPAKPAQCEPSASSPFPVHPFQLSAGRRGGIIEAITGSYNRGLPRDRC
jgi:ubiquinol-cytochrome c reductase cytochrome b subunit